MRPRIHTMAVGDLYSVTPAGSVPVQPGPVIAYFCALVPVVRWPGSWNTLVHMSSIGNRKKRSFMSGMLTIHGSLPTSSHVSVYSVSALGAVTEWSSTAGYVRRRAKWPIGAFEPSGFSVLVI